MRTCRRRAATGRGADSGETLIELIVAIAVMAAVGTVFLTGLAGATVSARTQATAVSTHALTTSTGDQLASLPFVLCASPADYTTELEHPAAGSPVPPPPAGERVTVTGVDGWDGSAYTDGTSSLADAVDDQNTTITVSSAAGLPQAGPYQLEVDGPAGELVTVTDGFGTRHLTVHRGDDASAHAKDAPVQACPLVQRVSAQVTGSDGTTEPVVVAKRLGVGEPAAAPDGGTP